MHAACCKWFAATADVARGMSDSRSMLRVVGMMHGSLQQLQMLLNRCMSDSRSMLQVVCSHRLRLAASRAAIIEVNNATQHWSCTQTIRAVPATY